jgi:hypothetical protein
MGMPFALLSLLNYTVVIEHYNGMDEYTEYPNYQPPITLAAWVVARHRMLRTPTGEQVNANTTVIVNGDPAIGLLDRITLQDGTQPPILSVHKAMDQFGQIHHTRIWL